MGPAQTPGESLDNPNKIREHQMSFYHSIARDGTHVFRSAEGKYLLLNGNNGVEVQDSVPAAFQEKGTAISCILGTIQLKLNKYVIIVTKHTITGSVMGKEIAKVDEYKILPLGQHTRKSSEESSYLDLLHLHLNNATLYFSPGNKYDVTNSLQNQYTRRPSYDLRFWWNHYISQDLIENGAEAFVTPVIYGYFKSHSASFNGGQPLEFALLTRRATQRAGTRYLRRGIDEDGNVANFNETEQIFTASNGQIYSFLQTRGSVPVYWSEINNLKYRPNLAISSRSSADASAKHFRDLVSRYGGVYCVNLVNQSGYEEPVKAAFESAIETLPSDLVDKVTYIYFDFHHECRNMRWDRVKLLLDYLIKLNFTSDNYFHYDLTNNKIISIQDKVIRTNCMDCLDRTNVVQSTLGRWVLQNQLTNSNYLSDLNTTPWELLDRHFNLFFMNFWADNANAVSCAYSGTGALKTDFTRTGNRTKKGAFNDLLNSITRYYKNNCSDGTRQDSYDLILGKYKPYQDSVNSPFIDRRPAYVQLLPYFLGTSILVMLAVFWFPRGSIADWKNLLVIGGCMYINARVLLYYNRNGYQFVNWPKLVALDFLKKVEVFDGDGKLTGIRYEEHSDFRPVGKKRS